MKVLEQSDSVVAESGFAPWLQQQQANWKRDAASLAFQLRTLTRLLKHPRVPWTARLAAGCSVFYLLSPIQLIPTFIPIIGQLDDLLVIYLGMKLVHNLAPAEVVAECQAQIRSSTSAQRAENRGLVATSCAEPVPLSQ